MAKFTLDTPLSLCLGKAATKRLTEAGFATAGDLLYLSPRRYYTWGRLTNIGWLREGDEATALVQVVNANLIPNRSGRGFRLVVNVTDGQQGLSLTFFAKNQYMLSPHQRLLKPGATALVSGKVGSYQGRLQIVQPEFEELEDSSPEAAARRAGRPIPIYRSISGLPSWKVGALIRTVLDGLDEASVPEVLPEAVRKRYGLNTSVQALRGLHTPDEAVDWESAKRTLAWEEALVLQTALLSGRVDATGKKTRRAHPLHTGAEVAGVAAAGGRSGEPRENGGRGRMAQALIDGLPFQLTDSQEFAWGELAGALASEEPMQRLLQADVGAGKTVMALLAMVSAVDSGLQAALLAPTEVLARQHYASLEKLLVGAKLDVPVHLLTGKRPGPERDLVLGLLAGGEPAIVVGTHALIQDGVQIPNLALLVVDEQHRFGVAQREKLREGRVYTPHLLVMTATPIPRTIAMTVFGDLDVTMMKGMPPGRKPVQTHLISNRNSAWMQRIWTRAREEVGRGGRVYVVCPRIDTKPVGAEESGVEGAAGMEAPGFREELWEDDAPDHGESPSDDGFVNSDVPAASVVVEELRQMGALDGIRVGLAHGRRTPEENAQAFTEFASGEVPILVATTVIEVGVDVPEATLMVVLGAQRFGLSQLHQLRGRVGRSPAQSVCLLVSAPTENKVTTQRLEAMVETTDGFALAEVDLRLRSEGDVLGQSQSGRFSGLRFLSLRSDAGVIASARAVAEQILAEDPTLDTHGDLQAQVRRSVGEDIVWLERS